MKNYEPTPRQSLAIREFIGEAITPLIEDVLVKKLGQAMAFLKEQEKQEPDWVSLTHQEIVGSMHHPTSKEGKWIATTTDLMEFAHLLESQLRRKNNG